MSSEVLLTGIVIKGDGRGKSLGFPTANLKLDRPFLLSEGIYAGWVTFDTGNQKYPAVIHAGPRPTFPGATSSFEVHILDFPFQELYGQRLTVSSLTKINSIQKFDSVDALVNFIEQMCRQARHVLGIKS